MLQYIIAAIAISVFGFLIFRKPSIETYVIFVMLALPIIDTKILPLAYGFVKVFDVVSVLSVVLFFRHFINFENNQRNMVYVILVILFWVLTLLSKFYSQFPAEKLYLLYQVFTIFIYTRFLLIYLQEGRNNKDKIINALKISCIVAVSMVLMQTIAGPDFSYYRVPGQNVINEETGLTRYPGMFLDSQNNSQFLAMASFIFLLFKKELSNTRKYLHYLAFAVSILALILAGGRAALGGFLIGAMLLLVAANNRIKLIFGLLGCLALFVFFTANPKAGIFGRADSISTDFSFRSSIWEETYTIVDKYPILGIGFGNYQKYVSIYHQDLYLQFESGGELVYFNQPENGYLKILVEQGVFAFAIFIIFFTLPILICFSAALSRNGNREMIFVIAAIIAWLVAFGTVYSLQDYRLLVTVGTLVCLTILFYRDDGNSIEKKLHRLGIN